MLGTSATASPAQPATSHSTMPHRLRVTSDNCGREAGPPGPRNPAARSGLHAKEASPGMQQLVGGRVRSTFAALRASRRRTVTTASAPTYEMTLSLNVLHHLGLNLYSSMPAVLSEVV